jgi:superfamily II DNA or RNA helicase
MVYVQYHKG